MKRSVIFAAACLMAGPVLAQDQGGARKGGEGPSQAQTPPPAESKPLIALPEPNFDIFKGGFDYAIGGKAMSDYIFRGITQTAHRPGFTVYGEGRYGWFYAGVQPWRVQLPTAPLAEIDIYGGIRPVWGPLTFDFGVIYYKYPQNRIRYFLAGALPVLPVYTPGAFPTTATDPSFVEYYAKFTYQLNDYLAIGANVNHAPNWNAYGAKATYYEANAKLTVPDTGFSVSGAFGRYQIGYGRPIPYGTSIIDPFQANFPFFGKGFKFASYTTWNVGPSYNWKWLTVDLRYSGTNLSRAACAVTTSDPAANFEFGNGRIGRSDWCDQRVFATVSIDFTSDTFK